MELRRWWILCLAALSTVGCAPDDRPPEEVGVARSPLVLTEQQKLTASDGDLEDYFGWGVAIDGDTAIIGAPHDDGSLLGTTEPGAA